MPSSISFFYASFVRLSRPSPRVFLSLTRFLFLNSRHTRDQLGRCSTSYDRSSKLEHERSEMQRSLVVTSSQLDQLSSENHGLSIAFDDLRRKILSYMVVTHGCCVSCQGKFDLEKQHLLDELDASHRSREALEQSNHLHEQDLRLLRDDKRASSEAMKASQAKIHLLEQQVRRLSSNDTLHLVTSKRISSSTNNRIRTKT